MTEVQSEVWELDLFVLCLEWFVCIMPCRNFTPKKITVIILNYDQPAIPSICVQESRQSKGHVCFSYACNVHYGHVIIPTG